MTQYNKFERGSEWAKWDLQVQPIKNEWLGSNDADILERIKHSTHEYLKVAIEKNTLVIGITDHNNGSAIDFAFQYAENKNIQILAGVELDTIEGWHLLVLFNPDLKIRFKLDSWREVVNHFLGNYAQIQAPFYKENGISKKVGLTTIDFISRVYSENIGLVVFAHCKSNDGFFQKSDVQGRKDVINAFIDNRFKFIFEIKDKYEQQKEIVNTVKGWYNNQEIKIPILSSSDAHKAVDVASTFTWIKANPTFEGLRQIIFEPERARIQEEHPDKKEPYNVIKSVRFIDNSGRFMNKPIYLNSGLNAIIGGKSTGKSLLLHFIAKTLLSKSDERLFEDKKGKSDKSEKYDFDKLDFEVEFADGKKFNLNQAQLPNNTLIEFIPQQWLSDMIEKHHKNETESPYQKLIEKSLSEKPKYDEIKKQHEGKHKSFEHIIKDTLIELFEIQEVIRALEKELAEMGNQQDFEKRIQTLEEEINTLKASASLSEEDKQTFESLQKQKATNLQAIKTCENNIEALKSYKEKLETDWKRFVSEVNENYNMVVQNFSLSTANFLEPIKNSLNDLNSKFQENIKQIESKERDFSTEKESLETQKTQIETDLKPFEEKSANFKKIDDCERSILDYNQKIDKIQKQESSISIKKEAFEKCKQNVKDTFKKLFEEYQNHIAHLNKEYSVIFKADKDNKDQIELYSELGFNYESFESNFLGNFNNKSTQKNKVIFEGESFENNKIRKEKYVEYAIQVFDLLLSEKVNNLAFISNKTPKMVIESLFGNHFQIDYKIKYENDWLENMSQGKKGIVLLKLYLAIEKAHYPILIDQPEDNLDNRTIYTSLTDFIKKRKIDRQIIMVTHNANLVIATDAEQVIVAHQTVLDDVDEKTKEKKSKFEYVTGALEHTMKKNTSIEEGILYQQGIREHVCEILEGGEIAFKKREEKYGLK